MARIHNPLIQWILVGPSYDHSNQKAQYPTYNQHPILIRTEMFVKVSHPMHNIYTFNFYTIMWSLI